MEEMSEYGASVPDAGRDYWGFTAEAEESELLGKTLVWMGEAVVEGKPCVLFDSGSEKWALVAKGKAPIGSFVGLPDDLAGAPLIEFRREDFDRERSGKPQRWAQFAIGTERGAAAIAYKVGKGASVSLLRIGRKRGSPGRRKAAMEKDLRFERRQIADRCARFSRSWETPVQMWCWARQAGCGEWRADVQCVLAIPEDNED